MKYVLGAIGIIALVGVIYIAISKKSTFKVRIAALVALGLMVLAVIVCIFVIFGGKSASPAPLRPDEMFSAPPPEPPPSIIPGIVFAVFIIVFFILILVISLREQRKAAGKKVDPIVKDNW